MFFFVFGWGHRKVQDHGAMPPRLCPRCHNSEPWRLLTVSEWVTLFLVPVFPTGKRHLAVCPICGQEQVLEGAALEEARRLGRF